MAFFGAICGCTPATAEKSDPCQGTGIHTDADSNFGSITEAVRSVPDGGTVRLCAGRFEERISIEHDVRLEGAGAELTTLAFPHPTSDPDDGSTSGGSPIRVYLEPSIEVRDLTVTAGANAEVDTNGLGGGLGAAMASLLLERVVIDENVATFGGALAIGSTGAPASVTIRDSAVTNNQAVEGAGIAIWAPATLSIENTDFGSGDNANRGDDIAIFDGVPLLDQPSGEPIATYDFEGVVSATCRWDTATCE